MTAGQWFPWYRHSSEEEARKESVVQGRQACMQDLRSTQRSVSNAGGIRSETWVGSVARIRGVYDAPGIH